MSDEPGDTDEPREPRGPGDAAGREDARGRGDGAPGEARGPGDRVVGGAVIPAVATVAALTLIGHPAGLGLTVVLTAVYGVAAVRRRNVWWLVAAALAGVATLRDAVWVVVPAVGASLAVASYAAAGGTSWRQVALGLVRIGALPDAGITTVRRMPWRVGTPAVRGAVIAALMLGVFVPLFATADAAFANILDALVPQESADRPITRALLWLGVVTLGGALIRVETARAGTPAAKRLARIEWVLPLTILVALFASFVALQLTTLFGGNDYVLRTSNLTYAEYARSGFAQLIVAAALTLAVIGATAQCAPRSRTRDVLLATLAALTLVILASAYKRLHLYEDAYGFTRLRLAADAAILWLAGLFALVLLIRKAAWLPRAALGLTAAGVLAFALSNPDGRIATRNLDRYEQTRRMDWTLLRHLSADATPALGRIGWGRCPRPDGLVSLNIGRVRARAACHGTDHIQASSNSSPRATSSLQRSPPKTIMFRPAAVTSRLII